MTTSRRIHRLFEGTSWVFLALAAVAVVPAFVVCGAVGHAQAQSNRRIFGALDPVVDFIRIDGVLFVDWLFDHAIAVGGLIVAAAVMVGLAGFVAARGKSRPLMLACAGVGSVGWGQVCIVEERFLLGTCLYLVGTVCAYAVGRTCPMGLLHGFPPCCGISRDLPAPDAGGSDSCSGLSPERTSDRLPTSPDGPAQDSKTGWLWLECALISALTVVGLLLRMYGLTELPDGFDNEVVHGMIQARTWHGISTFLNDTFLGPSVGFAHVPTQFVSYQAFGASIFAVRMASVFWGTLTIPLFYWLLRRMTGIVPAMLGTLLFIAAPEQLFWSRSENGQFAPMTFFAVVSGHLALWLGCRATWRSALAAALWMPVGTFFYFPCVVLTVLPALVWAYAVAVARQGLRSARHVLPLLVLGAILFFFGKSLVIDVVGDEPWEFHNPLVVHGDVAWKGHIHDGDPTMVDFIRHHAERLKTNLPQVARGLTHSDPNASHWLQRKTTGPHPGPSLNIAITALLALGIGFLLGQPRDLRAAVLLFWVVLALVPGVLSDRPFPRRIGMVYPAAIAIATIQLAVLWRAARVVSRPRLGRIVGALCGVLTVVIISTNLVSHFRLPIRPVLYSVISEFILPELEASGTIYHTFERSFGESVFLDQLDRLMGSDRPCIESLDDGNWPGAALFPECRFDEIYGYVLPLDSVEEMRDSHEHGNVSFIIHTRSGASSHLEALKALYPDAASHLRHLWRRDFGNVDVVRVPAAALSEMQHPLFLEEKTTGPSVNPSARRRLSASFPITSDGWYRFRVLPPNTDVSLRIDDRSVDGMPARAMLAGMHALDLDLAADRSVEPSIEIEMTGDRAGTSRILKLADLFHPSPASIPGIQAPPMVEVEGFAASRRIATVAGLPRDLGIDGVGRIFVLSWDLGGYTVSRFTADGVMETEWRPPIRNYDRACMAVDDDGRVVVVGPREMLFYSPDGQPLHTSPLEFPEPVLDAAFMTDGRILLAVNERDSLELHDEMGRHTDSLREFDEAYPPIKKPVGLAIGPDNGVLVVEGSGRALLFQAADDSWPPDLERVFHTGLRSPVDSRGCAFEGPKCLVVPNRSMATVRVYDRTGDRALARTSTHDLSAHPMPHPVAFMRYANTMYFVDETRGDLMALDIADP